MKIRLAAAALAIAFSTSAAVAAPLIVHFDFSKGAIGLDVTVKGKPLYMILDTGVDPSAIDAARAQSLGLKVDHRAGGEASGEGNARQAQVFPATIDSLVIGKRSFAPIKALAMDMGALSTRYGRTLDGVLGYSFLTDKIVLIDYARRTVGILDRVADAAPTVSSCRKQWSIPLRSFKGDTIPAIPHFHFGAASGAISLDTGSNGAITLYQAALALPGLRAALTRKGETSYTGARGNATSKTYTLGTTVGFGPFTLPAGQIVTLRDSKDASDARVANIGNKLFAAMKLKMLLDYREHRMTFLGECKG